MAPGLEDMKKALLIAIVLSFLHIGMSVAGQRYNSSTGSRDLCKTVRTEDGTVVNDRCVELRVSDNSLTDEGTYFLLTGGGQTGGYTSMTSSDVAVSTSHSYIKKAIADPSAGFDSGTLADGKSGQHLTIEVTEVTGSGTWTLTPTTATGFSSILFNAVGDYVTLIYIDDSVGWIIASKSLTSDGLSGAVSSSDIDPDIRTVTASSYSVVSSDTYIACDATSNTVTINLLAASVDPKKILSVKKTDSGSNACTLDGSGSETIDGDTTFDLLSEDESVTITTDGTEWLIF